MNDRHAFRARWHDYNGGIYFVTICTHRRKHLFGRIHSDAAVGTRFIASALGEIVEEAMHTEGVADFHHNSRLATIVGAFMNISTECRYGNRVIMNISFGISGLMIIS